MWSDSQQTAFDIVREMILTLFVIPNIAYYNPSKRTDAWNKMKPVNIAWEEPTCRGKDLSQLQVVILEQYQESVKTLVSSHH